MKLVATVALTLVLCAGCASTPNDGPPPPSLAEQGFEEAARELAAQVASQAIGGWPAHASLTGEPPRPHVRLGTLRNESGVILDMADFEARLTRRLVEGGKVLVAPSREELARRGEGAGPAVSFLITGSIHDDLRDVDGARTHTLSFDLRLLDVKDLSVVRWIRSRSSAVVER